MGLIRTATLLGAGYVLGARAGTERYDQIVATARRVAARPELQPYLQSLGKHLQQPPSPSASAAGDTVPNTETMSSAIDLPVEPLPVEPLPVEPLPVEPARVEVSRTGTGRIRPRVRKRSGT